MQGDKLRELLTEAVGFAPYDLRDSARLALYELLAIAEGAEADRADAATLAALSHRLRHAFDYMDPIDPEYAQSEAREIADAIDAALAGAVTQGEG